MVSGVKMSKRLGKKGRKRQEVEDIVPEEVEDITPEPHPTVSRPTQHGFRFQGRPPQHFSFIDSEWEMWFRTFERYRSASKLFFESDETQVNTLILTMGPKAETILESFNLLRENVMMYDFVVNCFHKYFAKKTNIIYERARFNKCNQKEGEPASDYITSLFELSKTCMYGDLRDELIRDRIVVGIADSKLSLSLQMDAKLTLETAISLVKQSELVKSQQHFIRDEPCRDGNGLSTLAVTKKKPTSTYSFKCYRCGSSKPHDTKPCAAREAVCFTCKKTGHFSKVCRSRKINEVCGGTVISVDDGYCVKEDDHDHAILNSLTIEGVAAKPFFLPPLEMTILVNDVPVVFKVDTGADITCIPNTLLTTIGKSEHCLQNYNGLIEHAGNGTLPCIGTFDGELRAVVSGKTSTQRIYVLKELKSALLGRPAIHSLKLLTLSADVNQVSNESRIEERGEFKKLFSNVPGVMVGGPHSIKLTEYAKPYAVSAPRRVPLPLYEKVRKELMLMESNGIISKVEEATEWCAPIVVATKKSGSIRLCGDFTELNRHIVRERFILPSTEEIFAKISGAQVFSKLDARMGFWQIQLSEDSKKVTTFITPFGRYCYNRMPFGISSAPEHFQCRVARILEGLEGCINMMDDILIWGSTLEEHNVRLERVLRTLKEANVTLNKDKCEFRKHVIQFLGHEVSCDGVSIDQNKVKSILNFQLPTNKSDLQRYLGMFTYLTKFVPKAASVAQPLRELLKENVEFSWSPVQERAFLKTKEVISNAPVLKPFDVNAPSRVSSDASSFALGGLLEQEHDGKFYPVMYISRAMTETERRYAQIEREALACTWACERLQMFLIGKRFLLQTDHKPLTTLLGRKPIQDLSPRLLRLRLRLMRFDYEIVYVPGKQLAVPDALSRQANLAVGEITEHPSEELEEEVTEHLVNHPVRDPLHEQIRVHSAREETFNLLKTYIHSGWDNVDKSCGSYMAYKDTLAEHDGLIMMGNRIVVPRGLREFVLDKLHNGHLGISKCRGLAKATVWWPGINKDIERKVTDCYVCLQNRRNPTMPLISTDFPKLPWSEIGADLFVFNKKHYLAVQDYFSRFLEIIGPLNSISSEVIILSLKKMFSRFGVPHRIRCDNGTQLCSGEMKKFAETMGFVISTSSPKYPQSNGFAESAVNMAKRILTKCQDVDVGLLSYRSAPLENGYSPAELLMGRKIRGMVPISIDNLRPFLPDQEALRAKEDHIKKGMKVRFDKRHGARELTELAPGCGVWIPDMKSRGVVRTKLEQPRSYLIELDNGAILRRNRIHVIPVN